MNLEISKTEFLSESTFILTNFFFIFLVLVLKVDTRFLQPI